jgi:hypothetical protein
MRRTEISPAIAAAMRNRAFAAPFREVQVPLYLELPRYDQLRAPAHVEFDARPRRRRRLLLSLARLAGPDLAGRIDAQHVEVVGEELQLLEGELHRPSEGAPRYRRRTGWR